MDDSEHDHLILSRTVQDHVDADGETAKAWTDLVATTTDPGKKREALQRLDERCAIGVAPIMAPRLGGVLQDRAEIALRRNREAKLTA